MGISAIALWLNTFFAGFDESLTFLVHRLFLSAGAFFTPFMEFISFLGKDGICLIMLSIILMTFTRTRRIGTAMLISLAVGALLTNCCLKIIIARPRPYSDAHGIYYPLWLKLGQHMESDKSFPSGHTTAAFASMTALAITGNKKFRFMPFVFAFMMGISRIYLVVHYPSDVLGGILVGVSAAKIGCLLVKLIPQPFFKKNILKKEL